MQFGREGPGDLVLRRLGVVREAPDLDYLGVCFAHECAQGVAVGVVDLAGAEGLSWRDELVAAAEDRYARAPGALDLGDSGRRQHPYLPGAHRLACGKQHLPRFDVLPGAADVLPQTHWAGWQHMPVLLAGVLDRQHGVGTCRDHGPGRDPGRLPLPHRDLGGGPSAPLPDEAQTRLVALRVRGPQRVAVHRRVVEGLNRDRAADLADGYPPEAG